MFVSSLIHERTLKNVLLYKDTVLRENHKNTEINIRSSQLSYTDVKNNMKIPEVITPTSVYQKL